MRIKLVHEHAKTPVLSTEGAVGFDLFSCENLILLAGSRMLVPTGVAVEIPRGIAGMVCPRSGMALNHGITVLNAPGVIDHDYRGCIGVILHNTSPDKPYAINIGDKIAQLVLVSVIKPILNVVAGDLGKTERGTKGFGSTGS